MLKEFVLSAVFKKELEGGYSALCPELGVASQGETIEEAENNLKEACELYIESAKEVGIADKVMEQLKITNNGTSVLTGTIKTKVNV